MTAAPGSVFAARGERLRAAARSWWRQPLWARLWSRPTAVLATILLLAGDFWSYRTMEHLSGRSWTAPGMMLGLLMYARRGRVLMRRQVLWTMAAEFVGFLVLGFAFGYPPLLLLRMAVINVALVGAGMWGYWQATRRRDEWYPSGPGDALIIFCFCALGSILSVLFGGTPESVLEGTRTTTHYVAWCLHVFDCLVLTSMSTLPLFFAPREPTTRTATRTLAVLAPLTAIGSLAPYLLIGFYTEWFLLLFACGLGLAVSSRLLGLVSGGLALVPLFFSHSPWSRLSWDSDLPTPVFIELMITMGIALSYTLVAFREQQGRLERQLARTADREAEQARLLRSVVGTMNDGVLILDDQLRVTAWNPAARGLVGSVLPADSNPRTWVSTYGLRDLGGSPLDPATVAAAVAIPEGESATVSAMRPGGGDSPDRHYEAVFRPFSQNGRRHTLIVIIETTHLYERRRELESFAGTVAHDLKNPLAAMSLWVETAQLDVHEDPEAGREATLQAVAAAGRMTQLIDDYLAYTVTREGELNWTSVELADVVQDVVAVHVAGPVDFELTARARVRVDRGLLHQLLANLVGNSVKYARPGTRAQVRISARPASEPGWLQVVVEDDGIGLGGATDLFEPFARTAKGMSTGSGIGLGLALCHAIVTRHGGHIEATDRPEGGARFAFTIPLDEALVAGPAVAPGAPLAPAAVPQPRAKARSSGGPRT